METKKAIITGASRGIGKGIAFSLAAAGYDVAISYHSKAEEGDRKEIRSPMFCVLCQAGGSWRWGQTV